VRVKGVGPGSQEGKLRKNIPTGGGTFSGKGQQQKKNLRKKRGKTGRKEAKA